MLILSRAAAASRWVEFFSARAVEEYEKRVAALEGPLAASRIAHRSRSLADELTSITSGYDLTRAWPFPGGARAWVAAAAAHVPGWAPDADR
ncbi:hypothetical protein [Streptomyces flavochromogenes]|uniref:hypothetical protein n=1 Tax=Streptomyces flavochromogenes TaxID=68199 RepID=UPI0004C29C02|nr:hypothetical protein [Streptomyces flavochromogenes]